ncbi:MAG: alpha-amylase family glycosyl hydrolase [Treponema sp.]
MIHQIIKRTSIFLFFCVLAIAGCGKKNLCPAIPRAAEGGREGVYYSLFVRAFADSNGDGIGDLKGIIQKLDYLNDGSDETCTDLGVTGIWLLPIFPSPSYHGYDVTDYYSINPEYGTMEDFELLISEAKKRGISIILDLPLNHSSKEHPWFLASMDKNDPHRSWYYWIDDEAAAQSGGISLSKQVWGHQLWNKTDGGYYSGLFDSAMPDFNLAEYSVREALKDVAAFWLKKGIAGFRLDAAAHIFNTNKIPAGTKGQENALEWWSEFSQFCKDITPDVYIVAEIWDTAATRAAFTSALESHFHFDLGTLIADSIKAGKNGKNNLARTIAMDYSLYNAVNPAYIDAPFLTNHDQNRIAGMLKGEPEKLKLAASLYLLTEGIPFIYYGEEIGMMGAKPDEQLRTPFLWNADKKDPMQTRWIESRYNKRTVPVFEQTSDSNSLLNHYRTLIRLKTGMPVLLRGRLQPLDTDSNALVSYTMKHEAETVYIVHNISANPVEIALPEAVKDFQLFYSSQNNTTQHSTQLTLAPYSSSIFTKPGT